MKHTINHLLLLLAATALLPWAAHAQGTTITYQGFLTSQGTPANGAHDFRFAVFDAVTAGVQQGGTVVINSLAVTNGLFTAAIDLGAGAFTGGPRWLMVGVRPAGSAAFTNVIPRQPITPAPYAIAAETLLSGAGLVRHLRQRRDVE